jgi:hypothetical protein
MNAKRRKFFRHGLIQIDTDFLPQICRVGSQPHQFYTVDKIGFVWVRFDQVSTAGFSLQFVVETTVITI